MWDGPGDLGRALLWADESSGGGSVPGLALFSGMCRASLVQGRKGSPRARSLFPLPGWLGWADVGESRCGSGGVVKRRCSPRGPRAGTWRGVAGADPVFAKAGGAGRGGSLCCRSCPANFSLLLPRKVGKPSGQLLQSPGSPIPRSRVFSANPEHLQSPEQIQDAARTGRGRAAAAAAAAAAAKAGVSAQSR